MPRSKREPRQELFLSEEGVKRAAKLYADECDRRDGGQEEICNAEDLSPSTGTKFRKLEYGLVSIPDASTIMRFGRQITDPATGNKFPPLKFLLGVCCNISAKDLVETALQIDPDVLQEFLHNPCKQDEKVTYAEEEDGALAIAEFIESCLEQEGLRAFEFAKRCKLETPQIHQALDPTQPLTHEIAQGLALGLSSIFGKWSAEMVKRIDPSRFTISATATSKLQRGEG
jgi:hypothetical protein